MPIIFYASTCDVALVFRSLFEDYNKQQKQNQNPKQRTCAFTAPEAKLLVVDDNIMNRKVFAKLLEPTKMQIDQAESGFECIDKMKENRYDIVFLDHMMPQMDGTETLRRLREMTGYPSERSVIIALTANAFVGARQQYISEGFDDFLPKPIIYKDAEELILSFLPSQLVERFEEE